MASRANCESSASRSRPRRAKFIRSEAANLAAMGFFSVEALTPLGIVRYLVCFVVDVAFRHHTVVPDLLPPPKTSQRRIK
jgi:hypothetical protein